jgi:hypothetical protein
MIDGIIVSFFDTVINRLIDSENRRIDTLLYETLLNRGNTTLHLRDFRYLILDFSKLEQKISHF